MKFLSHFFKQVGHKSVHPNAQSVDKMGLEHKFVHQSVKSVEKVRVEHEFLHRQSGIFIERIIVRMVRNR